MAKVCPDGCLFAEECSFAFGEGPWPEDCDLMVEEETPPTSEAEPSPPA